MPILSARLRIPGWDVLSGQSAVLMQGNGKRSCVPALSKDFSFRCLKESPVILIG